MHPITATMAGSVWRILVNRGDEIKEDQDLAILESMKMEIPIEARASGKINEVKVSEGDFVNEGDVLFILD